MTSKEFNAKYGLNNSINSPELFIRVKNNQNNFINVAGKPKKLPIEIAKRFFSNWATVLFTVMFIAVLIISLSVTIGAKFNPQDVISKNLEFVIPKYNPNFDPNNLNTIFATNENGSLVTSTTLGTPNIKQLPPDYVKAVNIKVYPGVSEYNNTIQLLNVNYGGYLVKTFLKLGTPETALTIINNPNGVPDVLIDPHAFYKAANFNTLLQAIGLPTTATDQQTAFVVNKIKELNPGNNFLPNSILGTNEAGFDIWTLSWVGTWNAIKLALIVATLQTIIGVAVGSYLGFHVGSLIDTVIMRLIDIFVAPPTLIWLLLFASTFGTTDTTLILALVFTGWTGAVGGTRLFIITVKDSEFITASKSIGASKVRLIYRHALPAIIGKIANSYVSRIPGIILSVSSLAFLGFFTSDNANLGSILNKAAPEAGTNVWVLLLPSLILLSISVSLYFMALGLHDALDPKVIRG